MYLDYESFLNESMYEVVKKALREVEEKGLIDDHHFFISFITYHPMVELSERIKKKHPKEMTIVLEYDLEDFKVYPECFTVSLSFDGIGEVLVIPIKAVTSFVDPKANFRLLLRVDEKELLKKPDIVGEEKVVSLENFRNRRK